MKNRLFLFIQIFVAISLCGFVGFLPSIGLKSHIHNPDSGKYKLICYTDSVYDSIISALHGFNEPSFNADRSMYYGKPIDTIISTMPLVDTNQWCKNRFFLDRLNSNLYMFRELSPDFDCITCDFEFFSFFIDHNSGVSSVWLKISGDSIYFSPYNLYGAKSPNFFKVIHSKRKVSEAKLAISKLFSEPIYRIVRDYKMQEVHCLIVSTNGNIVFYYYNKGSDRSSVYSDDMLNLFSLIERY
jgi:hypothetical protein